MVEKTELPPQEADQEDELTYERIVEDLSFALEELLDAEEGYKLAEDYFLGESQEKFLSERMRRMLSGSGTDFQINLASRVVYAVTDRLEIGAITATETDKDEEDPDDNDSKKASGGSEDVESEEDEDTEESEEDTEEDEESEEDTEESEEDEEDPESEDTEEDEEESEDTEEDEETSEEDTEEDEDGEIEEDSEETEEDSEEDEEASEEVKKSGDLKSKDKEHASKAKKDAEKKKEEEELESEATKALNDHVWQHNELDIEAPEIHEKATSFGDSYIFVWGAEDGENVDLFYNSPLTTRVIYDDENPREKRYAIKRWEVGRKEDMKVRLNLYYKDWVVKFISHTRTKGNRAQDFKPFVDDFTDEEGIMENPYGEIPIFHFRTSRPYGRPEHLNAYGPQDAITKLVKSQMSATDFAAYPQRWALADPGAGTDDDLDWGDQDDVLPENKSSKLVSGPGRVWELQNVREVGEFKAADTDQFLKPMDKYIELMAAVTGTPLSYLHKVRGTSSTPLSGESQKQTEVILLKKIEARKRSYSATWREAMKFAMSILGFDDVEINIDWAALQMESGKEFWEGVLAQQEAGVSIRQSLLEAGYTENEVDAMGYTADKPDGKKPLNPIMQAMADAPLPPSLQASQFQPGQAPPPPGGQPQPGAPMPPQPGAAPQQPTVAPPKV